MAVYILVCARTGENLWDDPQEPDGFGCLWDEGWGLLFTVYVLYLLNFVPCTCIIYSKNKVFKFSLCLHFLKKKLGVRFFVSKSAFLRNLKSLSPK